jgi:serine O-acetyltransferase
MVMTSHPLPVLVPEGLAHELLRHPDSSLGLAARAGTLPSPAAVENILDSCRLLLFPELWGNLPSEPAAASAAVAAELHRLGLRLWRELRAAYDNADGARTTDSSALAERGTRELLAELPAIRAALTEDAHAALAGDPAATGLREVVLAYPGHQAIGVYRIAHALGRLGVPLIPRMMTEHAHRVTGIDIHPGATIGGSFFIDHGTGVVIGETAVIGKRVRLYQGVTLGALSLPSHRVAELRHGPQRHPTLEDDVVVYAGATILGGSTVIGRGSVIGGNCWVVESVPPGSRVSVQTQVDVRVPGERTRDPSPRPASPSPNAQGVES